MAKTRQQKEAELSALREKFAEQKAFYFVDFKGLTTDEITELKQGLKESGAKLVVAKKTLTGLLFKELKYDFNIDSLEGQIAIAFGLEEPFAPAKTIVDFAKANKNLKPLAGGYIDNGECIFVDAQGVVTLASMPSREQLLGRLVGSISSPVSRFACVLNNTVASAVHVLNAIKDKKAQAA